MSVSPIALYTAVEMDLQSAVYCLPADPAEIPPVSSVRTYAAQALRRSLLKKYEDDAHANAQQRALDLFFESNDRCEGWELNTAGMDELDAVIMGEFESAMDRAFRLPYAIDEYQRLRERAHYSLSLPTPDFDNQGPTLGYIAENWRVGPGASVGASQLRSFYHKLFSSTWSTTEPRLATNLQKWLGRFPAGLDAESERCQCLPPFMTVAGSQLGVVPKNVDIGRTTCTEPLVNMLYQQAIGSYLERCLTHHYGIRLDHQPDLNRALCKIGSTTGFYGTADLKSASDSISLGFCHRFIPQQTLQWLLRTRSPSTALPTSEKRIPLHMVSSMGNGFTFPLMTLIFTCVVEAVYRAYNIRMICPTVDYRGNPGWLGNFGVFGDDIIVRREAFDRVCSTLTRLGFIVNDNKSFNAGEFRESCGHDYFRGSDVRGVYIQSLRTKQDRYSAYNRLLRWSCNHQIALPTTLSLLRKSVDFVPVPPWEDECAGLKVPFSEAVGLPNAAKRWHSVVYKMYAPRPKTLKTAELMQEAKHWEHAEKRFPRVNLKRAHHVNPCGILVTALAGYIRDGRISLRPKDRSKPAYETRLAVAPCWDYNDPSRAESFTREGWSNFLLSLAY